MSLDGDFFMIKHLRDVNVSKRIVGYCGRSGSTSTHISEEEWIEAHEKDTNWYASRCLGMGEEVKARIMNITSRVLQFPLSDEEVETLWATLPQLRCDEVKVVEGVKRWVRKEEAAWCDVELPRSMERQRAKKSMGIERMVAESGMLLC
ncbi:hypothetical protein LTS10_000426 [Elasticomyces elasticus]|nr:hypothetical protein LTS10_000426 [Elasticomyces elasticus]